MTTCVFEYGPGSTLDQSVPCSPSPGSADEAVAVIRPHHRPHAGNVYRFRINATNGGGTSTGKTKKLRAH